MQNYRFKRAAQGRKAAAVFFTIAFHVGLIGFLVSGGDLDLDQYLPENVKAWLGMEESVADAEETLRP